MKLDILKVESGKQATPTLAIYQYFTGAFNRACVKQIGMGELKAVKAGNLNGALYLIPCERGEQFSCKIEATLSGLINFNNRAFNEAIGLKPLTKYDVERIEDEDGLFFKLSPQTSPTTPQ